MVLKQLVWRFALIQATTTFGLGMSETSNTSALERAQLLQAPRPQLSYGGESEKHEWWDTHEALIQQALIEWGPKHAELYRFDEHFRRQFLDSELVRAVETRDKELFKSLMQKTSALDVYTLRLFNQEFVAKLLEELDHVEASGIPMRRPNGMNRYGAMLSQLGFSDMIQGLVNEYLLPLVGHLFPDYVAPGDLAGNYPFVVRYAPDQDTQLNEHTDASTVTVNICLESPPEQSNSVLYFKGHRFVDKADDNEPTFVDLTEPGRAVIHLGQQLHGVENVAGNRSNLVVWMFGEHGYVRIAPYEPSEIEQHIVEYDKFWRTSKTSPVDEL